MAGYGYIPEDELDQLAGKTSFREDDGALNRDLLRRLERVAKSMPRAPHLFGTPRLNSGWAPAISEMAHAPPDEATITSSVSICTGGLTSVPSNAGPGRGASPA
ncbi:hypothetical protein [Bradyrhizobium sp. Arg816]|uniref:hypothetical protein n=1 Tax=Bradyrhizobium sp. Arg816 TaxID=2998491 RepID=UPI00249EE336|nr:hypothetical protein [Bradyrhizobium sp. Arg816]MDI3559999.1 hypothetical protein [Bradyrhizobium sp. Arg816]